MTHEEAFMQDILERPDDDGPRLIFADWLEDNGDPERAEFIRLQIAEARSDPRRKDDPTRAGLLLDRNWDRWVAPLASLVSRDGHEPRLPWLRAKQNVSVSKAVRSFPRGFVCDLSMAAERFLANGEAILRFAALTQLRLHGAGGLGARLASCEALRWVRGIDFIDYFRAPIGREDMAALARSPYLGRLATLRLHRNNLGDDGVRALATAGWLPGIAYLDLTDNGLSMAGLRALTECRDLDNLRVLRLDQNAFDYAAALLLDAPWLDQLTHLSLRGAGISPDEADEICARAPRLHLSVG